MVRETVRPPEFRQEGFDEKFDRETVFYDCFRASAGSGIILPGPPFANLREVIEAGRFLVDGEPRQCRVRELDRHGQIWLEGESAGARMVSVESAIGRAALPVQENLSGFFEGRRVLLTISKNNPLPWVSTWIRFYVLEHGADAVLFYDNSSDLYDVEELHRTVSTVPGIDRACVVAWPFKWGPTGYDGATRWDSNFGQHGMLEHARWRFLQAARSVLNTDIDELVVCDDRSSLFDNVEASETGKLRFAGHWIENTIPGDPQRNLEDLRHWHFVWRRRPGGAATPGKWAVVPSRSPAKSQWMTHNITHHRTDAELSANAHLRHFKPISTSWKYGRGSLVGYTGEAFELDEAMQAAFTDHGFDDGLDR